MADLESTNILGDLDVTGNLNLGNIDKLKNDLAIDKVNNKSSDTIRNELTNQNVIKGLGYTPIKSDGIILEVKSGILADRPNATGSGMLYFDTDGKIWRDVDNAVWQQTGGQELAVATKDTLGGIKVGSNLSITEDGVLSANDNPANFVIKQEFFTSTDGQTNFTLTKGHYKPNTNSIFWYLNGQKQENNVLIETSSTTFKINGGIDEGSDIIVEYIELINASPFPYHANEHLSDGVDPIPLSTTTKDGLMTKEDKSKLNTISSNAEINQNAFSNIKVGSSTISADSKTDTLELVAGTGITLTSDTINDKVTINGINQYTLPIATTTTLGGIKSGTDISVDSSGSVSVNDNSHNHTTSNITGLQTELNNKVDKVTGKELSTNDYTTAEKDKLATIENNANKYIHPTTSGNKHIPSGGSNGQTLMYSSSGTAKWVNLAITDVSNLNDNLSNLLAQTQALGLSKVDKVNGKDLSSNDYTNSEKSKLEGIQANAQVNNISDTNATNLTNGEDNNLHYHFSDRNRSNHIGTQLASTISNFATAVKDTTLSGLSITTNAIISVSDTILSALGKLQKQLLDINTKLEIKVDKISGKGLSTNDYTTTEKDKLKGISSGAEVNQNAFSNIKVGANIISADSKSDTLELVPGSGITLTSDIANDKVTITGVSKYTLPTATNNILGGIKVGSNLSITSDGVLSANSNEDVENFIIKQEFFNVTVDGQTNFTLTKGHYKPNTNNIFWYLNGQKQENDVLVETSSTTFKINGGVDIGSDIIVEYIELINASPFPYLHANEHLTNGTDPIPLATISSDGLMGKVDVNKLSKLDINGNLSGNATTATKLKTARKINGVAFDGTKNITVEADNAKVSKALIVLDTRSIDFPPSEYLLKNNGSLTQRTGSITTEFKYCDVIGISNFGFSMYCILVTHVPWTDNSGGYPIQMVYGKGNPVWRVGISDDTWGEWQQLFGSGANELRVATDLNLETQTSVVQTENTTLNTPSFSNYIVLTLRRNSERYIQLAFHANGTTKSLISMRVKGHEWGSWTRIATTENSNWIAATFQNGWGGSIYYRILGNGLGEVRGTINKTGVTANATVIATLPVGYRPIQTMTLPTRKGNQAPYDSSFQFNFGADGTIYTNYNQEWRTDGGSPGYYFSQLYAIEG